MRTAADTISRELLAGFGASRVWGMLGWDDVRQRYRRSVLGPFWMTISMGIFVLLLGAIYSRLFKIDIETYLPYLTLGYILWGFVSQTTTESCRAFQDSERILKQIKLPYALYVFRVVWRNIIVFLHTIVIFIPIAIVFHLTPGRYSLLAVPGILILCVNQIWVSLVLAILCSRYRDIPQVVTTIVQIIMFATPIMWQVDALGKEVWIADVNPLYHIIELVRSPMLGQAPALISWIIGLVTAIVGATLAMMLLVRASHRLIFWI